jgi:shikimate kinase
MNLLKPHIFLVGFMGCGKSTAGRAVATILHRPFVDLDQNIEQVVGTSIAEIIERRGEPFFRTVETQCLQQSIFDNPSIIALGGGAFTLEFNRQIISRAGVSIWIDSPFELCWQRIQQEPKIRPLAPDLATASERYEARKPVYQLAELKISVSRNETPEHLAQLIINQLPARDAAESST